MLVMTPSTSFYFCVKDGEQSRSVASIRMLDPGKFSVRDSKGDRIVEVENLAAVPVFIHDYDQNYTAYVNWFADTNEIGFDCDRDLVHIIRYSRMRDAGFSPDWVWKG